MTIPTTISSFFGMNVGIPFASNPMAFVYVIFITLLISTGAFYIFVRNKWI
jgi:magnesium transporter